MSNVRVRLVPMTEARYLAWVEETISGFAAQQVDSGAMPPTTARAYAEREFDRLLPGGLATADQHVWTALDDTPAAETEVGYLSLGVRERAGMREGYVYDVAVLPQVRGRGYGRAIMRAGEERAVALGLSALRLNVFGHNAAARGLYEGLGYATVATLMHKDLTGPRASP